jgi:3-deoxy-manno-octulosonate cytidylyltransferase (CMP-KDO synthetase)
MSKVNIAAIIPARMDSSRYPGKPLIEIEGLPMIEHVRRRALMCKGFSDVLVATCDIEIQDAVESFGGRVLMTKDTHVVATERIVEAIQSIDCTHVVNVQGDEILILPSDLRLMVDAIEDQPDGDVWNAVGKVTSINDLKDPSIVNSAVTKEGFIIFFSRDFSSFGSKYDGDFGPIHINIGILGYSRRFLENFQDMKMTPLEKMESVEQFRTLENNIPIRAVQFSSSYPGINEPGEVELVNKILNTDSRQEEVLHQILNSYEK